MTSHGPDVSIVTAVYDVARYLPEFFESLAGQRGVDLSHVEIVAVDDGSHDDSLAVLHRYAAEHAARGILPTTVLSRPNGGPGAARNTGLDQARGTWVTFTDPDDTLGPDYLAHVLGFVAEHPDVELVATRRLMRDDVTGVVRDIHALRRMFAGDRLVDLDARPDWFHGSAPAAFFRREHLEADGLRFDGRIRPNFEDGHFCIRYLLARPRPLVGFLASADYVYRKRADGSGAMQRSFADPGRYTAVPRFGLLDALERGAAGTTDGRAPQWVQNFVLYELSWLFAAELADGGAGTAAAGPVADEFVDLLRRIAARLDPDAVTAFDVRPFDPVWRDILLHGLSDEPWHADHAVLARTDRAQRLVQVVHRFTGPEPRMTWLSEGRPVRPRHTKVRTHLYFDRTLLLERIAWLPSDAPLQVEADGHRLTLLDAWPGPAPTTFDPAPMPRAATQSRLQVAVHEPARVAAALRRRATRTSTRLANRLPVLRERFADAWVLMDRIADADDNAERLFEHLREHRPDINAWFAIAPGTPDHARLTSGPYADRVLAHGSWAWQAAMLSCTHLVSSHIDVPVHSPPAIVRMLRPRRPHWRFTFLQHGVIKDDLSRWLNPKAVDLFVTSTPGEYASVAGDRTPYVYTSKEVRLTGLPRFDRLLRVAAEVRPEDRDLVLVAPTWRERLHASRTPGPDGRRPLREDLLDTGYARSWLAFLRSDDLARVAREHALRIGFLPHPNLQPMLGAFDLPAHVEPIAFEGTDVQRLFASAAVLVTDYSSMAFNAAYVDRPVVYFQFDRDDVRAGGHLGRAGYFDYDRDGFGPVTLTADETVAAVAAIAARGCTPAEEYLKRIDTTFVLRDGRCCERVTAEIEALTRPVRRSLSTLVG